jgi:hypothetical protein
MPCNTHTLPNFEGIYTFVGSAVSPSNPNSFHPSAQLHERAAYSHPEHVAFRPSPQLRRVPRAPPPLDRSAVERALAQHPAARRIDLLHRSANSVTEPRRAPRAPPPLPDDDIDRIWSYLHERVAEHAESASSLTPLHSTSSAASLALGHPTRVPRAPPPLPRSTVTGPRSHLAAISPSASAIGAAQTSEQLLAIQMDRIRAATLRLAELDDAAEERAGEDSTYMPLPRWTLPPGATTRVLRVGQRTGGGSAGLDVDAAEYAEARRLGRDA